MINFYDIDTLKSFENFRLSNSEGEYKECASGKIEEWK